VHLLTKFQSYATKVAGVCIMLAGLNKQAIIEKNYNHIYNHEMAHKTAGGQYAGSISIERDSNGIPVSGHVPIQMPVLDKKIRSIQLITQIR